MIATAPRIAFQFASSALGATIRESVTGDAGFRLVLLVGLFLAYFPHVLLPPTLLSINTLIWDDAFYYMKPAILFWDYGYLTFDGVTHTNGVHPLWMIVLVLYALPFKLFNLCSAFPFGVALLALLLNLWSAQIHFTVLRRAGLPPVLAMPVILVCFSIHHFLLLSGLESFLVVLSVGFLVLYLQRVIIDTSSFTPISLAVGSLLVLLSRLDCGLFLLLLYPLLCFYFGFRKVFLAGLILTALSSPYFLFNLLTTGTVLPISGEVKAHWGDLYELEVSGRTYGLGAQHLTSGVASIRLKRLYTQYFPSDGASFIGPLSFFRIGLQHDKEIIAVLVVATSFLGLWLASKLIFRTSSTQARFLLLMTILTLTFYFLATVYYTLTIDRVWPWYSTLGIIVSSIAFILVIYFSLSQEIRKPLVLLWLTAVYGWNLYDGVVRHERQTKNFPQSLHGVYLDLAHWLENHTDEKAVAAGWAVGNIGWYSNRNVINLEGLIADSEVLEANGRYELLPYLLKKDVKTIVNFWRDNYPEEVLVEDATIGYLKGEIRYFWTLRLRPMMDCPEAFRIVHRYEADDWRNTRGYALGVNHEVISKFLDSRNRWKDQIGSIAKVIEAERFESIEIGRVEGNLARTSGYFVRGDGLSYSFSPVHTGTYLLYGRLCNISEDIGGIGLSIDSKAEGIEVPPAETWTHLLLSAQPIKVEGPQFRFEISSMSKDVYLDQIFLVKEEDQIQFESIPPDWWDKSLSKEAVGKPVLEN